MKDTTILFILLIFLGLFQSCSPCGGVDNRNFHNPIRITFNTPQDDLQISPVGNFNFLTSRIYDEENALVDSIFSIATINDWNQEWNETEVEYSRRYKMCLEENLTGEEFVYSIDINYSGNHDEECNIYEVNQINFTINDSIYYDGEFDDGLFILSLKI